MSFATKEEMVEILQEINSSITVADIPDMLVGSTADFIRSQLDFYVRTDVEDTLYIDGNGENIVFSRFIPIVSLTSITIIDEVQGTEMALTLTGDDKNVIWDGITGYIEYLNRNDVLDEDEILTFPDKPDSVKLVGYFGEYPSSLVKYLQTLLVLKHFTIFNRKLYPMDLVEEKIGRYSYKVATTSSMEPINQKKGIDGYIEWLLNTLKVDSGLGMESI